MRAHCSSCSEYEWSCKGIEYLRNDAIDGFGLIARDLTLKNFQFLLISLQHHRSSRGAPKAGKMSDETDRVLAT